MSWSIHPMLDTPYHLFNTGLQGSVQKVVCLHTPQGPAYIPMPSDLAGHPMDNDFSAETLQMSSGNSTFSSGVDREAIRADKSGSIRPGNNEGELQFGCSSEGDRLSTAQTLSQSDPPANVDPCLFGSQFTFGPEADKPLSVVDGSPYRSCREFLKEASNTTVCRPMRDKRPFYMLVLDERNTIYDKEELLLGRHDVLGGSCKERRLMDREEGMGVSEGGVFDMVMS